LSIVSLYARRRQFGKRALMTLVKQGNKIPVRDMETARKRMKAVLEQ
jgi:phage-related protein